jgi:hypothetical protein
VTGFDDLDGICFYIFRFRSIDQTHRYVTAIIRIRTAIAIIFIPFIDRKDQDAGSLLQIAIANDITLVPAIGRTFIELFACFYARTFICD